jgi:hypothetical protein
VDEEVLTFVLSSVSTIGWQQCHVWKVHLEELACGGGGRCVVELQAGWVGIG